MPYAQSGETSIYYDTYGDPDRPALVFAHGAGGNAASWWQQVPVFSADHHVVVFDHRGFGRSICPPEHQSAVHFEADVVAVMDAAQVDTAVIVCQSMGGWTGVRAAVYRTDRVRGVLLGNTPGAVRNDTTVANMRQMAERLAEAGGLVNRAYAAEFAQRNPAGAVLYRQISAFNTQARPNIRDDSVYVEPAAVQASGVPFLVLASDLDPLFPPAVLESVANDIGAPLARVDGAGHSTYFEKPDEFNAVVREFLDSIG
ncbi:MAG: alpha/beta hydrolase [Gammaproteobacteria bacterium]|nr:alpha/beta hydrolase [Gammaproteobacteria bacterium]MDE0443846.1 alpha/beta hydrolase [Gammaproteobacteria bacterium]